MLRAGALLALLLLALPHGAAGCVATASGNAEPLLTQVVGVPTPAATFYVVHDLCPLHGGTPCVLSLWVYEETNGLDGLQRGDAMFRDETCGAPADRLVW